MSETDQAAVDDAIATARGAVSGQTPLHQACRRIVTLRHRLGKVPRSIMDPIIAVDSELDDTPPESAASLWEPSAFQQKVKKRDEYIARMRPELLGCFHELGKYFGSSS